METALVFFFVTFFRGSHGELSCYGIAVVKQQKGPGYWIELEAALITLVLGGMGSNLNSRIEFRVATSADSLHKESWFPR